MYKYSPIRFKTDEINNSFSIHSTKPWNIRPSNTIKIRPIKRHDCCRIKSSEANTPCKHFTSIEKQKHRDSFVC